VDFSPEDAGGLVLELLDNERRASCRCRRRAASVPGRAPGRCGRLYAAWPLPVGRRADSAQGLGRLITWLNRRLRAHTPLPEWRTGPSPVTPIGQRSARLVSHDPAGDW